MQASIRYKFAIYRLFNVLCVAIKTGCRLKNSRELRIINAGITPAIAINPGTSVGTVFEMLQIVDKVLVMSVNPGNAGQMFMPYVSQKYDRLLAIKKEMHYDIYWDGACSADKIKTFAPKGVRGFVLGTTLLFGQDRPYAETIKKIREMKF